MIARSIIHPFLIVLLLIALTFSMVQAQNTTPAKDSLKTLSINQFFDMVLQYHPIAKQAALVPQAARQTLAVARGGFDPYFFSTLDNKQFDKKEYFFISESGFKVPTWYGIELKGTYSINRGTNISDQDILPIGGQALLGISAPIGQGLFIDERRATLKQAKIFQESSEFERITILNNLLFIATKDYWEWTYHYNNYEVITNALKIANDRFAFIKNIYKYGDIPAIDTLEAFINLQNLQFNANDALMNYRNATYTLSNHLWYEDNVPLEISGNLIPPQLNDLDFSATLSMDSVDKIINAIAQSHPDIRQMQYKIQELDIDRRLKLEYLKPKVNFNYNLLSQQRFNFNTQPEVANLFNNNYKWGFDIAFPLFWGKGRGNYKLAKLKIQDANYKLELKNVEIINKIQSYFNELIILKDQVALYENATSNYNKLLDAELSRFENGESSMFIINSRQMKLLEFQSKLLEVKTKYFKALAGVAWASGTLAN